MKTFTLAVLAMVVTAPAVHASSFAYLAQFRALDMTARATDATGQSNSPFIDSASNFAPYGIEKTVQANRSGASSMLTCIHHSTLGLQEMDATMFSFGNASRENPLSESSLIFNHNVFDVSFNVTQPTTLLIEGFSLLEPGPGNGIAQVLLRENISNVIFTGGDVNGTFGGLVPLQTGVNYRVASGADVFAITGVQAAQSEAEARLGFHIELGAVVADTFATTQGLPFGGTQDSLRFRDEDAVSVLNDEMLPIAEIEAEASSSIPLPTSLRLKWLSRGTRNDLSEFTYLFNFTTSKFDLVQTRAIDLTYRASSVTAGIPIQYVGPTGQLKARLKVVPQTDLETSDGWAYQVDYLRWNIH